MIPESNGDESQEIKNPLEMYYHDTLSDDEQEDESNNTLQMVYLPAVPVRKTRYAWCPKPYQDDACNDTRKIVSRIAGLSAMGVPGGYSIGACIACCMGQSCTQVCGVVFEPDLMNGILMGVSACLLSTAGCAWAPWFDKNGCNVCKKIEYEE